MSDALEKATRATLRALRNRELPLERMARTSGFFVMMTVPSGAEFSTQRDLLSMIRKGTPHGLTNHKDRGTTYPRS